uniref:Uncharacterized protein n=1 Tax=Abalone asfa-like virus TaxID=2839893 RepID=A0A5K7Y3N5_9VIRU|nr:hypothetical protein [Abalone asfa-like virus]
MEFFRQQFCDNKLAEQLSDHNDPLVNRKLLTRIFRECKVTINNKKLLGKDIGFYLSYPDTIQLFCLQYFVESASFLQRLAWSTTYRTSLVLYVMFPYFMPSLTVQERNHQLACRQYYTDVFMTKDAFYAISSDPDSPICQKAENFYKMFKHFIVEIPSEAIRSELNKLWALTGLEKVTEIIYKVELTLLELNKFGVNYLSLEPGKEKICGIDIKLFSDRNENPYLNQKVAEVVLRQVKRTRV